MSAELQAKPSPRPLRWGPIVYALQELLAAYDGDVFLVGGVVRDAFWGIPAHDIDLVVPSNAFRAARFIANRLNGAFYKLDPERETGRALVEFEGQQVVIDVAVFRGNNLLQDLTGRDFTLNAVAAPLAGSLDHVIDPLNGLQDAQDRVLRRCSETSISSDPIRALRAVRMSVRFSLRMEPQTAQDVRREGPRITTTSPERVRDDFMALLGGRRPFAALRTMDALGILELILPEVVPMRGVAQSPPHNLDVWGHTLATVEQLYHVLLTVSPKRTDNTAAQAGLGLIVYYLDRFRGRLNDHIARQWPGERSHAALLMLAALLHDSGKPATQQVVGDRIRFLRHEEAGVLLLEERAKALRLSNQEISHISVIVRHHMRPHLLAQQDSVSRRAIYRFWRDTGSAGVDICLLALADYLAIAGTSLSVKEWGRYLEVIGTLLAGYFDEGQDNVTTLPVLVTGDDLMKALGLSPGPVIGELLEHIREAQAEREIHTKDEALALAQIVLENRH